MTFNQLTNEFAKRAGITQEESGRLLKILVQLLKEKILGGHKVIISQFMTFFVDVAPQRKFHNGFTMETTVKPRRFVLKTKISKTFKTRIDGKKTYQ